jgi:nucleoside-triphosphatase THEP1
MIQGAPGSGKTTLIERIVEKYRESFSGFFTKEVKENQKRIGFDLVSLRNKANIPLARIGTNRPRVGKYEVYLDKFAEFLDICDFSSDTVIIDEIGKMECFSIKFTKLLEKLYREKLVIATIPVYNLPIMKLITDTYEVDIFQLNRNNRDEVLNRSLSWIKKRIC